VSGSVAASELDFLLCRRQRRAQKQAAIARIAANVKPKTAGTTANKDEDGKRQNLFGSICFIARSANDVPEAAPLLVGGHKSRPHTTDDDGTNRKCNFSRPDKLENNDRRTVAFPTQTLPNNSSLSFSLSLSCLWRFDVKPSSEFIAGRTFRFTSSLSLCSIYNIIMEFPLKLPSDY